MLVAPAGVTGKKACLVVSHLADALRLLAAVPRGSLAQAQHQPWDVEAPVTGASMAIFYGSGVFFAVVAGLLLLRGPGARSAAASRRRTGDGAGVRGPGQVQELHLDERPPAGGR